MSGVTELMKYTILDWTIEETSTGIEVTLVFGRKILNEILTTYLPTSLLVIIVHSTNYYKEFFFEAVVTVNLTGTLCYACFGVTFAVLGMLVLSTMFVSVSGNLPVTSDVKMIEIWLIFNLLVPFTEVLLQVTNMNRNNAYKSVKEIFCCPIDREQNPLQERLKSKKL